MSKTVACDSAFHRRRLLEYDLVLQSGDVEPFPIGFNVYQNQ